MRTNALSTGLILVLSGSLWAAEPPADEPDPQPASEGSVPSKAAAEVAKTLTPPPTAVLPPVPPGKVRTGGMLPKLRKAPQPWELLNPLAGPEYGDGTDVLAINPVSGEAEGVTVFSISLPEGKPKAKKAPKAKKVNPRP